MSVQRITSLILSILLVCEQALTFAHAHEPEDAPHVHFSCPWSHDEDVKPRSRDEEPAPEEPVDEHDNGATFFHRAVVVESRPRHAEFSTALAIYQGMTVIEHEGVEEHLFSSWPHAPPLGLHADRPIYLSLLSLLL